MAGLGKLTVFSKVSGWQLVLIAAADRERLGSTFAAETIENGRRLSQGSDAEGREV